MTALFSERVVCNLCLWWWRLSGVVYSSPLIFLQWWCLHM